jgi:hypothetical protein
VGLERQIEAIKRGMKPRFAYRDEREKWGGHVVGAMAEMALAKWTGLYWSHGVNTFRWAADVAAGIEVRWNNWEPPKLKIRDDEKLESVVVLVSGVPPLLQLRGWIVASEGMRPEWRAAPNGGPPAYFIPLANLKPMGEMLCST